MFVNEMGVLVFRIYLKSSGAKRVISILYWNGQLVWTPSLGLYL